MSRHPQRAPRRPERRSERSGERVLTRALLAAALALAGTAAPVRSRAESLTPSSGPDVALAPSITYMTLSTVYVSVGRDEGVSVGDELEVLRDGAVVGRVRVQEVSSHRAACVVVEKSAEVAVGDRVDLGAATTTADGDGVARAATMEGSTAQTVGPASGGWQALGLHGRVGARFLAVEDRTGQGQSLRQPALDLRLEGDAIAGSPFDLAVDVRTRRTYRSSASGTSSQDGRSRVYRAALTWAPAEGRFVLGVGRQLVRELPALGIVDGASAAVHAARWSVGLLSGSQPDPFTFGLSTEIREHAGFLQLRSAPGGAGGWSTTLGVVASYDSGEINREYAVLQATARAGRVTAYASQDFDLNRGWKLDSEGESVSLTNTFSNLRVQAAPGMVLAVGYDNRRNVRLYRDHVSPEIEFDDTYRQGVWAGVDQRIGRRLRVGGRVKRATGGATDRADSYTLHGSWQWRVTPRWRSTRFTNALVEGWMHSGAIGAQILPDLRLEAGGGLRRQTSLTAGGSDEELRWTNLVVDWSLAQGWFASASFERSENGPQANDQLYTMLSRRF